MLGEGLWHGEGSVLGREHLKKKKMSNGREGRG
jgi:hypothetical protein